MDAKAVYMSKPWLKHYPPGVPHTVDIAELSIPQMFDQAVEKFRSKTALIFYGKKISYGELRELTDRFAGALSQLGVKKGDTVALYLLNCPQYVIAYFGALKAGAKVTPISPVYTSHEVKHQIEDSDAKTVVCQDILYDNLEWLRENGHPKWKVVDLSAPLKGWQQYDCVAKALPQARRRAPEKPAVVNPVMDAIKKMFSE